MVAHSPGRQHSAWLSPIFVSFLIELAAAAAWTGIQGIPWRLALHHVALPGGGTVPVVVALLLLIAALVYLVAACMVTWVILRYAGVFMVGGARAVRDYRRRKRSSTSAVSQTRRPVRPEESQALIALNESLRRNAQRNKAANLKSGRSTVRSCP
jgi:hypothetical protein